MMFGLRKRPKKRDPAVLEAMAERDLLLKAGQEAVEKVDRMVENEFIEEYEQANGLRRGEAWDAPH